MSDIEAPFLARLKDGDEAAFAGLVADLGPGLLDFARTFTSSTALAEDIVQETWLGVIRGLHAFAPGGVELGTELRKGDYTRLVGSEETPADDASTQGLINYFRGRHRG